MISASCPSCAAPVSFAHGAAVTAVCAACQSCVVRTDRGVESLGKVSAFDRDLSPLQVDASGVFGKRRFRVVGVVRLGRERVRWNEWAVLFDDGSPGWLGESNGQFWMFGTPGENCTEGERARKRGAKFKANDASWVVVEAGDAEVIAAEGALPYRVAAGIRRPYADLRRVGGGVGTLDLEGPEPVLFAGEVVDLPALRLDGLRPFAGWSDPALVHFRGPDVTAVKKLDCPGCGASLPVRAPGLAARVVCAYCGAANDLDAGAVTHSEAGVKPAYDPLIPLGTRGKLRGVEWQVIGAMVRSVRVDGVRYPWEEYFCFNPWRGSGWLVCANGHWSWVELLGELPSSSGRDVAYDGVAFRRFQSGVATVDAVLGEFTWEVHAGDRASTVDYVAPPLMLSSETTPDEVTWSRGTYLSHTDVATAFGVALPGPTGVAPHQPNPWLPCGVLVTAVAMSASLAAVGLGIDLLDHGSSDDDVTTIQVDGVGKGDTALSESFSVPDTWRTATSMALSTTPTAGSGVTVSLVNESNGNVYEQSFTDGRSADTTWKLSPGDYVARFEVHAATSPLDLTLVLRRDEPGAMGTCLGAALALGLLVLYLVLRGQFETARWSESDQANDGGTEDDD